MAKHTKQRNGGGFHFELKDLVNLEITTMLVWIMAQFEAETLLLPLYIYAGEQLR
jgi:hypothetical protein